jgi:hypothetical protein
LPRPGIDVTATDPWGNASTVTSGSKPEHGVGGFEFLAPHRVAYRLAFLEEEFEVQVREGTALVTFTEMSWPEPEPEPEPDPEADQEPDPGPPPADRWKLMVEKLKRIEALVAKLPEE